jgi:outer membrane receptor protein involved in Fe transport
MRTPFLFTRLFLLGALLLLAAGAAEEARKAYELAPGDANTRLKEFSEISGREILFAAEAVRGVQTAAVRGTLTATEALDRLLAGTGLRAVPDPKTGAVAIKRESDPNVQRAAQTENSDRPQPNHKVEKGVLVLDTVQITGSRLRANSGDVPMQPVLTYSSLDIARTGASNLGQFFQYIPAITSYSTGLNTETVNSSIASGLGAGQTQSRITAQLRGGSQTSTLLLVDGKRVPLTALRNSGGNGYDLGGIPLSAVERVEVLLDGASAIYGADAINGVINVILKKRYSGTEVNLNYDNTFDTDAAVMTASVTHGFSRGRWSGLLTFSASENNILLLTDRRLTSSFDRTIYGGITNQSQPTLYAEGTGSLNVASGNLSGTTTPRVSIPAGYAGGAITIGDYTAAPAPIGGITPGRRAATSYSKDHSLYVRLAYEFSDLLTITGTARSGRREFNDNGDWRRIENVTIPVGYPGNPFSTAVRLSKTFYDLPPIVNGSKTAQEDYSLMASGKLPGDWRYEAGISYVQGVSNMVPPALDGAGGLFGISTAPATQFTARLNAEIAAGRRPLLIYDSNTQSPNAPGALDRFWVDTTQTRLNDRVRTWTYSAQADGKVWSIPAGDITAVLGAEAREEYVSFPGSIGGQVWPVIPQRDVTSFYAETRVPIVGEKQRFPLLHRLDVNLAARTEDYSDFGRSTTERYGVAWRPFKSVLFRGSFGEGFLAPQLYRTAQQSAVVTLPASTVAIIYAGQTDLSRGNAPITGPLNQLSGGNPGLRPQLSENWTYGVVLDVPKVSGLSLSFDYYDYRFTDGFGGITSMMDRQIYAPETIVRGDRLSTDPVGWLGPITGFDGRIINISSSRSAGYSFGLRYQRTTDWGDVGLTVAGEKTIAREERILPSSAPTASVNKRYVPQRVTFSAFWSRAGWDAGITAVHSGKSWTDSSNVALYPSRDTASVTRWDVNGSYDFGRRAGSDGRGVSWWSRALHGTKLRLTVINLFDTEPPLNVNGSFGSSVIDMRLRRYILDLTKRF